MKTILVTLLASAVFVAAQAPPTPPVLPVPPSPAATRPSPPVPAPPSPGLSSALTNQMQVIAPRSGAAVAPTSMDDMPTNTFNFPSIDINQFLTFYAELIGRTILRPASLPAPTITLKTQAPLTRKEALQAFDTLLAMNGITIIKIGDKFAKVVPSTAAFQEAAPFSKVDPEQLPETGQYDVHLVQLKYVKPEELAAVLNPFGKIPNGVLPIPSTQMIVIRDYAENVRRMLEMIKQIDIAVPAEFISEVIPIKYALASEISSALSSLSGGGGGGTTVGRGSTGTTSGARSLGTRPTTPGYPGSSMPGMPGSSMGMSSPLGSSMPGATPAAGGSSFTDRLRSIMQKATASGELQIIGTTKIIADERTNSLLVFASRQDMAMIKEIIGKLDVVLAQVLIEAIILEVSIGDTMDYGISYLGKPQQAGDYFGGVGAIKNTSFLSQNNFLPASGTNAAGGLPSGFSYFGKFGQDFEATLTAAATDSRVNVLSRPRIQTSHAVPAAITVGISRPVITGQYSYYGGGPQSQYQYQNFGITLNVTPLINPEGLVVMDIDQQIQNVGRDIPVDANFSMPEVTTRSATAKVAVQNKETVILGGFISSDLSDSKSGVPILKDIPLLGHLFSSVKKKKNRSELIVLIRPTVLETPEIAAKVAKEERNSLPGIRRAETENQIEERKLLLKETQRAEALERVEESKTAPKDESWGLFKWLTPAAPAETKAPAASELGSSETAKPSEPPKAPSQPEPEAKKVPAETAPRLTPQSSGPDTTQGPAAAKATAPDERRAKAEAELARKLVEKEAKKKSRAEAEAARKAEEQRLAAEKARAREIDQGRKQAEADAQKQARAAAETARKAEEQRLAAEKAQAKAKAEPAQKQVSPEWDLFNQVTPVSPEQKKALDAGAAPPP